MELNKIEALLGKYELGETSLVEEKQLRTYFSKNPVPPHLQSYGKLFAYFESDSKQSAQRPLKLDVNNNREFPYYFAAAAIFVIMFTAFMNLSTKNDSILLSDDELYAYDETLKAFNLIANHMNKWHETFNTLNIVSRSFERGENNINFINEFSNTMHKIFKIK